MRQVMHEQLSLGELPISDIKINLKSRDDVPKILLGIQHVYNDKEAREEIFEILESAIPSEVDKNNGRPGLELWRLFVLGMLRVHLNWDFDRLTEMANNHKTIRQMLGHTMFDDEYQYERRTLHNNFALLTPEILDRLNQVIIKVGHKLVKKKTSH